MSNPLPHAVNAPENLRREAMAAMDAARRAQKSDAFGRVDWLEVSRQMRSWWKEHGYAYP